MEAEGNAGITQVKAEYQIQQAQSQWMTAYQALQQAEQSLAKLQEGTVACASSVSQKAAEAARAANDHGFQQALLARIYAPRDTFYSGHEGGFQAEEIEAAVVFAEGEPYPSIDTIEEDVFA